MKKIIFTALLMILLSLTSLYAQNGTRLIGYDAKTIGRGGYTYGSNPVPDSTVFPVFPAIVENHIMLGASYQVSKPLSVNLAYEMALNNKQDASSKSIVASEYDNSTSQLQTMLFHLSISWKFK